MKTLSFKSNLVMFTVLTASLILPNLALGGQEGIFSFTWTGTDASEDAGGRRYTTWGENTDGNYDQATIDLIGPNIAASNSNPESHDNPGPGWFYIPTGVDWQPRTRYSVDFVVANRFGHSGFNYPTIEYGMWAGLPDDDKGPGNYNELLDSAQRPGDAALEPSVGTEGNFSAVLDDGTSAWASNFIGDGDIAFSFTTGENVPEGDMVVFLRFGDDGQPDEKRTMWNLIKVSKESVVITSQPQSQVVNLGEEAQFEIEVDQYYDNVTYQWYRSEDDAVTPEDDEFLSGEDSSSLTISNVQAEHEGYYYCRIEAEDEGDGVVSYSNTAILGIRQCIGYWTLDEDDFQDGHYLDSSGQENHAVPNIEPDTNVFVEGVRGEGLNLSADPNAAALVKMDSPAKLTGQMTLSVWVKWAGPIDTFEGIAAKREVYVGDEWFWNAAFDGGHLRLGTLCNDQSIDSPGLTKNRWTHLAFTLDEEGAKIYRDGLLEISKAGFKLGDGTDAPLVIGGNYSYEDQVYSTFNGIIDEVKIYNYALSELEIADIYYDVSGREPCVNPPPASLDINQDCIIDMRDLAVFTDFWLQSG